ncbi:hypothetical protein M9458_046194, partial [Cirrhinus mrigala]
MLVNTLQEAKVDVIDTRICNLRSWYDGHVNDNMICAGFDKGGVDTCQVMLSHITFQSNCGGPLQCYSKDMERFYLYGVTSHGEDCALPKKPGIYTRASRSSKICICCLSHKSASSEINLSPVFLSLDGPANVSHTPSDIRTALCAV